MSGVRRIRKQSGGLFSRRTRKHGGAKRRVWRKVHIRCPTGEWHIRREGGSTNKRWRSGRSRSAAATSGMPPCCPNCWPRSPPIRTSPVSPPPLTVCLQTTRGADRGAAAIVPPRKTATPWKTVTAKRGRAQRGPEGVEMPRPRALATPLGSILRMRLPGNG